jgi:hypothetical protein
LLGELRRRRIARARVGSGLNENDLDCGRILGQGII